MKKVLSMILVLSFAVSMCACSALESSTRSKKKDKDKDKDDSEVIDIAEDFAKAVTKKDKDALEDIIDPDDFDKAAEIFEDYIECESYSSDDYYVFSAIIDSLEYEVDEDSAKVDDDSADIDVIFTVADFESVSDEKDYLDGYELSSAITDSSDTKEIKVSLKLENDDDDWFITNGSKALKSLCIWSDFIPSSHYLIETTPTTTTTDLPVVTEPPMQMDYADAFTGDVYWYYDGEKEVGEYFEYENTIMVELDLVIYDEYADLDWINDVDYDIYCDGEYLGYGNVYLLYENGENVVIFSCDAISYPELTEGKGYFGEHEFVFDIYEYGTEYLMSYSCSTSYVDKGFEFTEEFGNSDQVDNIYFIDWYFAKSNIMEMDIYLKNFSQEMDVYFEFYESSTGNLIYSDHKSGTGLFIPCYTYPEDAGLKEFKGKYYVECKDADGNLICKSEINIK